MEKSWKDAIKKVLSESDEPLHYTEITEQILSRGYFETDGATPARTVNAQITTSLKNKGSNSPFLRVGKGIFSLRIAESESKSSQVSSISNEDYSDETESVNEENSDLIIHSFGMYWQRSQVVWRTTSKMFGKQSSQSKLVDFGKQKGIYVLYDHHAVVYVGRAIDRPLGKRLYEHTIDRLGSRWNQFSWFGLLDVTYDGDLREASVNSSLANLVATFEAILIETLEPPQNRKRGDDFSANEFIQGIDPEIKEKEIQNTLKSIEQLMKSGQEI